MSLAIVRNRILVVWLIWPPNVLICAHIHRHIWDKEMVLSFSLLPCSFLQTKLHYYLYADDKEINIATQTCLLASDLESKRVSEISWWVSSPWTKVYVSKTEFLNMPSTELLQRPVYWITTESQLSHWAVSSAFLANLNPGYDFILLILFTSYITWMCLLHLHHIRLVRLLTPCAVTQIFWPLAETKATLSHSYKSFQPVILTATPFS